MTVISISSGRILRGAFFIPVGMFMSDRRISKGVYMILFAGCFCTNYFIDSSVISSLLLYLTSIAFFGIILSLNLKDYSIYPIIRKLSIIIYLIHMYVWTFYYALVYKEKTFGWDNFIVTLAICLTIGLFYCYLSRKKFDKFMEKH